MRRAQNFWVHALAFNAPLLALVCDVASVRAPAPAALRPLPLRRLGFASRHSAEAPSFGWSKRCTQRLSTVRAANDARTHKSTDTIAGSLPVHEQAEQDQPTRLLRPLPPPIHWQAGVDPHGRRSLIRTVRGAHTHTATDTMLDSLTHSERVAQSALAHHASTPSHSH